MTEEIVVVKDEYAVMPGKKKMKKKRKALPEYEQVLADATFVAKLQEQIRMIEAGGLYVANSYCIDFGARP